MQTGLSNRPHLATKNFPEKYKPTFNGVIATLEDLRLLLEEVEGGNKQVASCDWNKPPLSYLAGQTFIWNISAIEEDSHQSVEIRDGAFWSRGISYEHSRFETIAFNMVLQIQMTEEGARETYMNAGAQGPRDRIAMANPPANGNDAFHFNHFAHHLDRHSHADNEWTPNSLRLIRQQLLARFNGKRYLVTSYYFQRGLPFLNRPTYFVKSCFGKIEYQQDVEKLVDLVEAGRVPCAPEDWLTANSVQLARSDGAVLVWMLPSDATKTSIVVKTLRFHKNYIGTFPGGNDKRTKYMVAWEKHPEEGETPVGTARYFGDQAIDERERLKRQRIDYYRDDQRWLILAFSYESSHRSLAGISELYASYEAASESPSHHHQQPKQQQRPFASSSSHPHGS